MMVRRSSINLSSTGGRLYSRLCTLNWALCESFPALSYEKKKAGVFDGPQIRQLMKDNAFPNSMNETKTSMVVRFCS